ncbi:hypothetical protein ASPVEDRAFT_42423 [Aspergillus versicolor CBS 583.65]|uniref:Uncharacterized protein n=1 Tax=Aspergillus versicolor CBS 583.65 TaxID=1036611 RepID=A0A1L9PMZ0_ASPVE|nr:uncharacterized protein ASPVEDRAFT_42423 [Aspergillus versicolor CBS 583.65]OJJ02899.1 hypothetical protein ASPVEDRAFT_42423 [Aspergillus versicolor CBS 583.65]
MPFLWGNPASHFGTENDEVYGNCHSKDVISILMRSRNDSRSDEVQTDPQVCPS